MIDKTDEEMVAPYLDQADLDEVEGTISIELYANDDTTTATASGKGAFYTVTDATARLHPSGPIPLPCLTQPPTAPWI